VIKQSVVIKDSYHFFQLHTKFYPISSCKVNSIHTYRGNC